jgi:hypothetical protein
MLELAELAVLAVVAEVPMIAHLLTCALHTLVKRGSCGRITWWQWFV